MLAATDLINQLFLTDYAASISKEPIFHSTHNTKLVKCY